MEVTCKKCGKVCDGPHNMKWCVDCKSLVLREWQKEYRARNAKAGTSFVVAVPIEKQCPRCGVTQPSSEFGVAKDRPNGLQTYCHKCCNEISKERKAAGKDQRESVVMTAQCVLCGETFEYSARSSSTVCVRVRAHTHRKYCSDACRREAARQQSQQEDARRHKLVRCTCIECGKTFVPEYLNKHRSYCSDTCMNRRLRRVGKSSRRARARGAGVVERIDPVFILSRDGWRCYVCGCKTPRRLRGTTEQNAPEVDHVIPLARGGAHNERNLKCICRQCNQQKSDRMLWEIGADVALQYSLL